MFKHLKNMILGASLSLMPMLTFAAGAAIEKKAWTEPEATGTGLGGTLQGFASLLVTWGEFIKYVAWIGGPTLVVIGLWMWYQSTKPQSQVKLGHAITVVVIGGALFSFNFILKSVADTVSNGGSKAVSTKGKDLTF